MAHSTLELAEKIILPKALGGDNWARAQLLLIAADGIAMHQVLPPGIATFISFGLRRIHRERIGEAAFGIARRRGEKDTRRANRRAGVFAQYIEHKRHTEGLTLEKAIEKAAILFSSGEDAVKRGWKKYHRAAKREVALELQYLGRVSELPDDAWKQAAG